MSLYVLIEMMLILVHLFSNQLVIYKNQSLLMQFLIRYNKRIYFLLGAIYDLSKYTRVFLSKDKDYDVGIKAFGKSIKQFKSQTKRNNITQEYISNNNKISLKFIPCVYRKISIHSCRHKITLLVYKLLDIVKNSIAAL